MSNIPLNPPLLQLIRASFPQVDDKTHPLLRTPHDAIAILVHACMLSTGFRLVGYSEDDNIGTSSDESEPKPLSSNWNSHGGSYGFRYSHSQSPMQYLVKINRLGEKTVIIGMGLRDDKISSFDITTKDFTSETFFPFTMDTVDSLKKLTEGFISENRIVDLATLVKINIVEKLIPGLYKSGDTEERLRERAGEASPARQQSRTDDLMHVPRVSDSPYGGPRGGPSSIPAVGEIIPGFDDEYEIIQPQQRSGYRHPPGGRNPLSIGADDLNPPGLGSNPPLRGPFFGEESGMHPTPDHPMFGGRGIGGGMIGGPRVPPNARYDPVGPGDEPPTGGLRGPRGPGGPPGGPFGGSMHNPFSNFGSGDFM